MNRITMPPGYQVEELLVERRLKPDGRRGRGGQAAGESKGKARSVARLAIQGRRRNDRKQDPSDE